MKKLITLSIILLAVLAGAYYLSSYLAPRAELNALGEFYLRNSYFGEHSAGSPEVVTAILWDYRGLDTYFETAVLFMAIISAVSIFRNIPSVSFHPRGFTNITKTGVKIVGLITFVAAATTAFHGHITPGGGFQGGSMLAVVPLLVIVGFSKKALEKAGLNKERALVIRTIGLLTIALAAFYPLLAGGRFMQNLSIYPKELYGMLVSGSLSLFNMAEFLAVGAGFTIIFLLLSNPEGGSEA
ncbi:MAG TPA: sodium:proton antiporter [Thermococcus sp.]|nr:sodium:proton antiporter [Thermococcus sp.]